MLWFRQGKIKRSIGGPYRGLRFAITPQTHASRMQVSFRAYESEVTDTLRRHLIAPMIVFDIGAHVGIHAIYAARLLRSGGAVYAFEPWPENFVCLEQNIALNANRIGTVGPIRRAIGGHQLQAVMVEGATDGMHHLAGSSEVTGRTVAMTTLDSAAAELGACPDLVIVDVEGPELQALEGGTAMIARNHPVFILEHHGDERRRELTSWLRIRGYEVTEISARHILAQFPRQV